MTISGKTLKVYSGHDCGAVASPLAVVHATIGNKIEVGLPTRAINAIASAVRRPTRPVAGPAVGPGASVIQCK
jgi:hypothetical protein